MDHLNQDGLDNRYENLRYATSSEQNRNQRHRLYGQVLSQDWPAEIDLSKHVPPGIRWRRDEEQSGTTVEYCYVDLGGDHNYIKFTKRTDLNPFEKLAYACEYMGFDVHEDVWRHVRPELYSTIRAPGTQRQVYRGERRLPAGLKELDKRIRFQPATVDHKAYFLVKVPGERKPVKISRKDRTIPEQLLAA